MLWLSGPAPTGGIPLGPWHTRFAERAEARLWEVCCGHMACGMGSCGLGAPAVVSASGVPCSGSQCPVWPEPVALGVVLLSPGPSGSRGLRFCAQGRPRGPQPQWADLSPAHAPVCAPLWVPWLTHGMAACVATAGRVEQLSPHCCWHGAALDPMQVWGWGRDLGTLCVPQSGQRLQVSFTTSCW